VYFTGGTVTSLQLELAGTAILFIFTFLVAPWYTVLGGIVAFIGFMCLICVPSFQATIPVGDAFFSYVLGWIFWFCVIGILQWLFRKMNRTPKTESHKIEEFAHQLEGRGMSALEIAKLYARKMAAEAETESERAEWAADVASWARIEPEAKTAVKAAAEAGTAARVPNRQLTITPASDDTMDAAIAELIAEARACHCKECEDAYHVLGLENGADAASVKSAYRDLAMVWHPDRFGDGDTRLKKKAEEQFSKIHDAYTHLQEHQPQISLSGDIEKMPLQQAAEHTKAAIDEINQRMELLNRFIAANSRTNRKAVAVAARMSLTLQKDAISRIQCVIRRLEPVASVRGAGRNRHEGDSTGGARSGVKTSEDSLRTLAGLRGAAEEHLKSINVAHDHILECRFSGSAS
jgi:DnaJ-domain-containing protein 1